MAYDYIHAMQILRNWKVHAPALVYYNHRYHVFTRTVKISSGETIEAALEAGGYIPPAPPPAPLFVAVGNNIVKGDETVGSGRSKTMALRIANALNEYTPGDRGY